MTFKTPKGPLAYYNFSHVLESIGKGNKMSIKYLRNYFTMFLKVLLKRKCRIF